MHEFAILRRTSFRYSLMLNPFGLIGSEHSHSTSHRRPWNGRSSSREYTLYFPKYYSRRKEAQDSETKRRGGRYWNGDERFWARFQKVWLRRRCHGRPDLISLSPSSPFHPRFSQQSVRGARKDSEIFGGTRKTSAHLFAPHFISTLKNLSKE